MAIRDINPARIYVTSNGIRYYATDPVPVAAYLNSVGLPNNFTGKANGYRVTSDGAPGTGYILLKRSQLDAMDLGLSTHSITFETPNIPSPAGTTTIANLHITGAVAVTGTINEKPDDIYLVEFKDNVEYAQLSSLNKGYNNRTPDWVSTSDFLADSLNGGIAWTWATMLADIWTNISPAVGALTTALVSFPTSNPDNFANFGDNAWNAAQHLCRSTHHRLICSRSGAFHAISEGAADPTNTAYMALALTNKILLNPSHPKTHTKTSVPAVVKVFFSKRNTAFQLSTDVNVVTGTEQWHSDPTYAVSVTSTAVVPALAATGVIPNTEHPIYDSMVAVYNELGILQNAAALTTQAEARATAYINSLTAYEDARNDLYNGAVPFEIGPNFTCIHWYDFGEGVRTQTFSSPKKAASAAVSTTPATDWPGMPDISRYHLPFERFAVGEVYNAPITPGGSGIVRVQFGTRTSSTVTTWADTGLPHEIRAHDILEGDYPVGSRVFCAFHRQTSRWVIVNNTETTLVHFELTNTLALSGDASAIILSDDGADWADTAEAIQVYDWYASEGMWAGITGYRGLAVKRDGVHASGRKKYDIVWMEQIAQTIQFTSTEYMGYTTANRMEVTVNWFDHQGKDPGSTVIVRDPQGQFPDVHSGAKGTAVYDYHNLYYRVVACQRVALFAQGLLDGASCGSSMTIDTFAVKAVGDYVGSPPTAPTIPTNTCDHYGRDNDTVLLRRIDNTMPQPTWEVVDIEKHPFKVYTALRQAGTCDHPCVEGYGITAALEVCAAAPAWETIFCDPCSMEYPVQTSLQTSTGYTSVPAYGCCVGEYAHLGDLGIATDDGLGGGTPGTGTIPLYLTITDSVDPCETDLVPSNPNFYNIRAINPRTADINEETAGIGSLEVFSVNDPGPYPSPNYSREIWTLSCETRVDPLTDIRLFPSDFGPREWVLEGSWANNWGRVKIYESGVGVFYVSGSSVPFRFLITANLTIHSCNPFHATASFTLPASFTSEEGGVHDIYYPYPQLRATPTTLEFTE